MKFSTSIEYAVHGLIYLAQNGNEKPALISDISNSIKVPEAYLRKVFQQLVKSGLVVSQRGSKGGFRLSREPGLISLKDIVEGIDGTLPMYSCLKTVRGCSLKNPCPVHEAFENARLQMAQTLGATSLADLLSEISGQEPVVEWLQIAG